MTDWHALATAYADRLVADGHLTDPRWHRAFATTARHLFVPRYWALDEYNSPATLVDGAEPHQRGEWLEGVYSDRFLITQWAPSALADGRPIRAVTSSASQPCVVAVMLDRLDVHDGHRVLEIGTGTGYNSALLCSRLGDELVSSVDIDPALIRGADTALAAAGYRPRLHPGDGARGLPDAAPFDRIIATCSVDHIPAAWVEQLAPGGKLVVPFSFGGALGLLEKTSPEEVSGRVDPFAVGFMPLRESAAQPMPARIAPALPAPDPHTEYRGHTDVDPRGLNDPDFQLWLALHLPAVTLAPGYDDGNQSAITVYDRGQRATAGFGADSEGLWPVRQQGHRPWDTVEAAWRSWQRCGRPTRNRIGITARSDGRQHFWLDDPTGQTWPAQSPSESLAPA